MSCSRAWYVCVVTAIVWMSFDARAALGQLLVSDRVTNTILQFGWDGSFQKQLVGPANSLSTSDLDGPAAMAFGNGNDLFVASQNTGEVLRFDRQTGQYLGSFASGIYGPGGLMFDPASNVLYVSEFGNMDGQKIDRFNAAPGASFGASLGSIGLDSDPKTGRAGMALGPDGALYVSSFFDGRILRVNDPAGSSPSAPTTFAQGPMGFMGTNSLVFDSAGNLDAVGLFSFDVYRFGGDGTGHGDLISAASGSLAYPCAAIIAPNGNLLVSSMGNDKPNDPFGLPIEPGYISEYNISTGAVVNQFFIHGIDPFQPTAMLVMPTPEPSTLALTVVGCLAGLAWATRRRLTARPLQSQS
jgi:hypothetical protein